jgi:hypothetical protein
MYLDVRSFRSYFFWFVRCVAPTSPLVCVCCLGAFRFARSSSQRTSSSSSRQEQQHRGKRQQRQGTQAEHRRSDRETSTPHRPPSCAHGAPVEPLTACLLTGRSEAERDRQQAPLSERQRQRRTGGLASHRVCACCSCVPLISSLLSLSPLPPSSAVLSVAQFVPLSDPLPPFPPSSLSQHASESGIQGGDILRQRKVLPQPGRDARAHLR